MKTDEVPQEDAGAFEKEFKVLQYAVDENGKFTTVKSVGWNPKTVVMQNAWDFENEKAEIARQLVLKGKKSPLYYHAKKNMMNAGLLAGYTGFCRISVMLHFYPGRFKRLSHKKLKKYADVFGFTSVEQLFQLDTKE